MFGVHLLGCPGLAPAGKQKAGIFQTKIADAKGEFNREPRDRRKVGNANNRIIKACAVLNWSVVRGPFASCSLGVKKLSASLSRLRFSAFSLFAVK